MLLSFDFILVLSLVSLNVIVDSCNVKSFLGLGEFRKRKNLPNGSSMNEPSNHGSSSFAHKDKKARRYICEKSKLHSKRKISPAIKSSDLPESATRSDQPTVAGGKVKKKKAKSKTKMPSSSLSKRRNDKRKAFVFKDMMASLPSSSPSPLPPLSPSIYMERPKKIRQGPNPYNVSSFSEFYNRVMDALKVPKNSREHLNFYEIRFASQLLSFLRSRDDDKLLRNSSFRNDLARLLFKWFIYMRQELSGDDHNFELVSCSVNQIVFKIKEVDQAFPLFNFDTSSMNQYEFASFKQLIKCEFMDNFNIVFPLFENAIKSFYVDREFYSRSELKEKYFQGNFNNVILLKFMFLIYDPLEGLIGNCFPSNEHLEFVKKRKNNIDSFSIINYLESMKSKGPEDIEDVSANSMSHSMIKFFLDNGMQFRIFGADGLFFLLRKMNELKVLALKPIEKVVKFEFIGDGSVSYFKWDKEKFMRYMNKGVKEYSQFEGRNGISQEEYNNYIALSERTNLLVI